MIKVLQARLKQGYRTKAFSPETIEMPARFLGVPVIDAAKCAGNCQKCLDVCPVKCIAKKGDSVSIDLGKCIFCGNCAKICTEPKIKFTKDYSLSARKREDLLVSAENKLLKCLPDKEITKIFGRSLKLRQVSAGGCNACEADINVLNTLVWDLGRFGVQFVASPRHADGILVTGPVTHNMLLALKKTYEAIPATKIVIATGACAISGGIYGDNAETCKGVDSILPVDLYIPGCPPHPATILDGILRLLGKVR